MDIPPQPLPDVDSEPFWAATEQQKLSLCHCGACVRFLQPPLEACPVCSGPTDFREVSGRGRIHSFVVTRRGSVPGYLDALPYVNALVDLDEQAGLRLPALLIDADPDFVEVGQRVDVTYIRLRGGDFVLPAFRIADERPGDSLPELAPASLV